MSKKDLLVKDLDSASVDSVIAKFKDSGLSKLSIKVKDMEISMELPVAGLSAVAPLMSAGAAPVENKLSEENGTKVTSPLVGTFYGASAPGKPRFVEVGSQVAEGDTLCIIEAMKVMNEIKAPVSGRITNILVKEAQMVEYDEVLFTIE